VASGLSLGIAAFVVESEVVSFVAFSAAVFDAADIAAAVFAAAA
jgi:hypothetical protein